MFKKKISFKIFDEERNKHLEDLLEKFILKYTTEIYSVNHRRAIFAKLMKETIEIASNYYKEKSDKINRMPNNGFFKSEVITNTFDQKDFINKYNLGGNSIEN